MSAMTDLIEAIDRYKHYAGRFESLAPTQTGMTVDELAEDAKKKLAAVMREIANEGL